MRFTKKQFAKSVKLKFDGSVRKCSVPENKTGGVKRSKNGQGGPDHFQEQKPDLDRSIDYAICKLFEKESVVKTYELYEAILQHAQGLGVNLEDMKARVTSHPGLVVGMRNEMGSAEHYRLELESVLTLEKGRGMGVSVSMNGVSSRLSQAQHRG